MPDIPEELKKVQRPRSAFWFFQNDRKVELARPDAEGKELVGHEITKVCNAEWQVLSDDRRKRYTDLAAKDVERYEAERKAVYDSKGLEPPEPYVRMVDRKKMEKKRLFQDISEPKEETPIKAPEGRRILKAKRLPVDASVKVPLPAPAQTPPSHVQHQQQEMEDDDEEEGEEVAPSKKPKNVQGEDASSKKKKKFSPIHPRDKLQRILMESMHQKPDPKSKAPKQRTPKQQLHKTLRRMKYKAVKKKMKRL